jgi:hypothetical protein
MFGPNLTEILPLVTYFAEAVTDLTALSSPVTEIDLAVTGLGK